MDFPDTALHLAPTLVTMQHEEFDLRIAIADLLFPPMSAAQANIGLKDWGRVAKILPGTRVKVKLTQKGKKLKGKLVSSDENGIHVALSDGSGRSIGRTSVSVRSKRQAEN